MLNIFNGISYLRGIDIPGKVNTKYRSLLFVNGIDIKSRAYFEN